MRIILSILLASVVVFTMGCSAATSPYMHVGPRAPIAARAGVATVVFIRPSDYAKTLAITVTDGKGRFLGVSLPKSYFATSVPAGEHLFTAWAENTGGLRAKVEAGRVYYVEVSTRLGMLDARVHLVAIAPRTKNYPNLATWLADSQRLDGDEAEGQRFLDRKKEDVADHIRSAEETYGGFSPEVRPIHTLEATDGQ